MNFAIGQQVAVMYKERCTGQVEPERVTKIVRATAKTLFTEDAHFWTMEGRQKDSPQGKSSCSEFISALPEHLRAAIASETEAKEQRVRRQQMTAERDIYCARPDVKLADRLCLNSYTEDQARKFWLTMGEDRLRALVAELETLHAFDVLK